jgi:hypothetical protein
LFLGILTRKARFELPVSPSVFRPLFFFFFFAKNPRVETWLDCPPSTSAAAKLEGTMDSVHSRKSGFKRYRLASERCVE